MMNLCGHLFLIPIWSLPLWVHKRWQHTAICRVEIVLANLCLICYFLLLWLELLSCEGFLTWILQFLQKLLLHPIHVNVFVIAWTLIIRIFLSMCTLTMSSSSIDFGAFLLISLCQIFLIRIVGTLMDIIASISIIVINDVWMICILVNSLLTLIAIVVHYYHASVRVVDELLSTACVITTIVPIWDVL